MLAMKVKIDERSFREAERILRAVPGGVTRVFRRAIRRAVDKTATEFKARMVVKSNIKKGEIGKGLKKRSSATSGSIAAKTTRTGLLAFKGTSQTKRGVTYRIEKAGGRKTIEHGFIATMPEGQHRGVFVRKGKSRLPIIEARGPSIWQIITGTAGLLVAVVDGAGKLLSKIINDQITVEFKRWKR